MELCACLPSCQPFCPLLPATQLAATNPRNRESVRYATRAVLLLADYLQAVGQQADANWALMKAHFQVGACSMDEAAAGRSSK